MENELIAALEARGWRVRLIPIERLRDVRDEIQSRFERGALDEGLYREYLSGFAFAAPENLPEAQSVILVTIPQPQVRLTFHYNGQPRSLFAPPTYLYWRKAKKDVADALTAILEPGGHRVVPALVPQKLLAVRSGLADYGRNNITYVEGMGSFHRPMAFFSDIACAGADWREPKMLERCERCAACRHACPTGAIVADRFLIHAERCLTFLNEKPGDVPFPDWVDPSWHNCVIGCMRCQSVCPENRDVVGWVEDGGEFTEDETRLLLEGAPIERLPAEMLERLKQSDLDAMYEHLARNLRPLLLPG